jgi:hypothetical protein
MPLGPAPSAAARYNNPIASVFTLFGGVDIAFLTAPGSYRVVTRTSAVTGRPFTSTGR